MSKRKLFREQDELEEQELLAAQDPVQAALDFFYTEGLITEVLYTVKSGKEATVYCCQAHPSTGAELLAAKVYRPRNNRGFKNDAIYQEGRVILEGHVRRAVQNKSRFGREAQFAMWVNYEFEALRDLGTLVRQRETVRLYGPFPTERRAFRQRIRCRVKRSRSKPTLLARHAGQGRGSCQLPRWSLRTPMMLRPVKPKRHSATDGELRWRPATSP